MRLQKLRIQTKHPYTYTPRECTHATVGSLYWDDDAQRIVAEIIYDNGFIDWYPICDEFLGVAYERL